MAPKPKLAPKNPLPLHKALRNLERAYGIKCTELDAAEKRIADLEQQLKDKKQCPIK